MASLCDCQVDGGVKWLILLKKGKGKELPRQKQVLGYFTQNGQKLGDPVSVGVIQQSGKVMRDGYSKFLQQGFNGVAILEQPRDFLGLIIPLLKFGTTACCDNMRVVNYCKSM